MNAREHFLLKTLAASFTPTTLAAVVADLERHSQLTNAQQGLADEAKWSFKDQLACMVGESEAEQLIDATCEPSVK